MRAGITTERFWALTPAEALEEIDAFYHRERRRSRFHAAMTANVMNMWTRRRITVDKLLGSETESRSKAWAAKAHLYFSAMADTKGRSA